MITCQNAMDKALDYLKGYNIPFVITVWYTKFGHLIRGDKLLWNYRQG